MILIATFNKFVSGIRAQQLLCKLYIVISIIISNGHRIKGSLKGDLHISYSFSGISHYQIVANILQIHQIMEYQAVFHFHYPAQYITSSIFFFFSIHPIISGVPFTLILNS